MKFHYTHTFADYRMLGKRVLFRIRGIKILLFFSACLILCFLFSPFMWFQADQSIGATYLSSMTLLILPALMALLFISSYFATKKRWNIATELRCEKTYDISDSGIHVTASGIDGRLGWQYIAEAELWRGWVVIITNQKLYYFFPLSAVPEPDKLISLLVAKIGKTKGMKRA